MTGPLARPESLNRYAYVVNSPATAVDPSGNFIVWQDCFLDSLLPECQCDPENGCPPELLLLLPPPDLGVGGFKPCDVNIRPLFRAEQVDCSIRAAAMVLKMKIEGKDVGKYGYGGRVRIGGVRVLASPAISVIGPPEHDYRDLTAWHVKIHPAKGLVRWELNYACDSTPQVIRADVPLTCE